MNKKIIILYVATIFISKVGTGFFFFLNTWLMIDMTGYSSSAAISLMMTVLPSLLLSPLMGVVVDKTKPARLAFIAEVVRWGILMTYAVIYKMGMATAMIGYSVSFCIACGSELQQLAWRTALAKLATSQQILQLNAFTVVGGQTGVVIGAATAGMLFMMTGVLPTLLLASATYFMSSILSFIIAKWMGQIKPIIGSTVCRKWGMKNHLNDLRNGFLHILERPQISFFYLLILMNVTVLYSINGMLAPFVRDELHLQASAFGKIDACYSVGAIIGGLMIAPLTKRYGARLIILLGFAMLAISVATFSQSNGLMLALMTYIGIGMACQTSIVLLTLAQKSTETDYQGRVYATFNTLNGVSGFIVYGIVALTSELHIYRELFLLESGLISLVLLWLVLSTRATAMTLYPTQG